MLTNVAGRAIAFGGAVRLYGKSSIEADSCAFLLNRAAHGTALVAVGEESVVRLRNSTLVVGNQVTL